MGSESLTQRKLFDEPRQFKNGLVYRPEFITPEEEEVLLIMIEHLPLRRTKYEIKTIGESVLSKKRAGWFTDPLPRWLSPLQARIGKWLDVPKNRLTSALINEYISGTGMGWHRDEGNIDHLVGVSLGSRATIRFRPYNIQNGTDIIALELEPRSAYIMQGPVHREWQHSIMPVKEVRYSLTFRTAPS